MQKYLKPLLMTAFLIISQIFISGCFLKEHKRLQIIKPPPVVKVAVAEAKTVPLYSEYVASVDPTTGAEIVDIRARVEAYLIKQCFLEGRKVNKGEVLFLLDPSTYQADLNAAKAALEKGQANLYMATQNVTVNQAKAEVISNQATFDLADIQEKRYKTLAAKKAVPQQDYDKMYTNYKTAKAALEVSKINLQDTILTQKVNIKQANAEIDLAKAQMERASINLGYCTITSPINGIISKRYVAPGNLVGHGEATLLAQVTNLDTIRINFNISEADYLKIFRPILKEFRKGEKMKKPMPLELILTDGSIYSQKGKIDVIEPTIDPQTATLNLIGIFDNPHWILRPGMFGRIRVVTGIQKDAVLIPVRSYLSYQDSKLVYVVNKDNTVSLRSVTLGPQIDMQTVIILKGITAGETVVTDGQLKLTPNVKVQIDNQGK